MERLQLYIARPHAGLKSLVNINPRDDIWAHAVDARQALEEITYDPREKVVVYVLQYTSQGTFVTVVRTIPPTPLNYLGAWIFVPNGLQISADDLTDVAQLVTRKISAPKFDEAAAAELRQAFSKEYLIEDDAPRMAPSHGLTYACAPYGGDTGATLATYLGQCIFQPQWEPYKGVILLDADLGLGCEAQLYEPSSLETTTPLLPPAPGTDTRGFTPNLYGVPLTAPTLVALDRDTTLVWKRPDFDDVSQTIVVTEPDTTVTPPVEDITHALKMVGPSSFYISSPQTRHEITGCTITVNGIDVSQEPHAFSPDELTDADVQVSCPGYFAYSSHLNLAASKQALIQLKMSKKVYRFELPLSRVEFGDPIHFEVYGSQDLSGSPIEGYRLSDGTLHEGVTRTNRLEPLDGGASGSDQSLWWKAVWGAVGIVIGLVIMFFVMRPVDNADEPVATEPIPAETAATVEAPTKPTPPQEVQEAPAAATTPTVAEPTAASIAYLDGNKAWSRESLEQQPGLQGLYDDLNSLNTTDLVNKWGQKLSASKNFTKIVEAAERGTRKGSNPHRDGRTTFSTDGSINWLHYTYWIDP